jgi:hypothetical protein
VAHTGKGHVTIVTVKLDGGFFGSTGICIGAWVLTNWAYCAFAAATAAVLAPDEADVPVLLPDEDEPELELPHPARNQIVATAIKTPIADVVGRRRTGVIISLSSRVAILYIMHKARAG